MLTTNYTELRSSLKKYFDLAALDGEEILVPRSHEKGVVLISLERYNELVRIEASAGTRPDLRDHSVSLEQSDKERFLAYARAVLEAAQSYGSKEG